MTTKEFLDKYDSNEAFTEEELSELWSGDTDVELYTIGDKEWSEPGRWNTCVSQVIQVQDRYFNIYAYIGNTEMQDTYYNIPPEEVRPVQKVITYWEVI